MTIIAPPLACNATKVASRSDEARIRLALTSAWQTSEAPSQKTSVIDEVEHVGFYLAHVLYRSLPVFYEGFADAVEAVYGQRIALPQVVRFALPGYANVWQVLVKSTAVVSVIGLQDLVGRANDVGKTLREPFLFLLVVLAVYLAITWASTRVLERLERRAARGIAHAR